MNIISESKLHKIIMESINSLLNEDFFSDFAERNKGFLNQKTNAERNEILKNQELAKIKQVGGRTRKSNRKNKNHQKTSFLIIKSCSVNPKNGKAIQSTMKIDEKIRETQDKLIRIYYPKFKQKLTQLGKYCRFQNGLVFFDSNKYKLYYMRIESDEGQYLGNFFDADDALKKLGIQETDFEKAENERLNNVQGIQNSLGGTPIKPKRERFKRNISSIHTNWDTINNGQVRKRGTNKF